MPVQPIRLFGDPVLRTPAAPVTDFDKELRTLVEDLTDTMRDAPGAGLAAPQIGVGLRVFTWWVDDELGHLVNPVLHLSEDEPGRRRGLPVPARAGLPDHARAAGRGQGPEHVRRAGRDRSASDLLARCVQHETDHLDGILFIDRLDRETRKQALRAIREAELERRARTADPALPARHRRPRADPRCDWSSQAPPRSRCRRCTRCWTPRTRSSPSLTRPDAPAGRGRTLTPSPVAAAAAEAGHRDPAPGRRRATRTS